MVAAAERVEHEIVMPDERDIPHIKELQEFLRASASRGAQLIAPDGGRLTSRSLSTMCYSALHRRWLRAPRSRSSRCNES